MNAPVIEQPSNPIPPEPSSSPLSWPDWIGVAASIACAIHCAVMPFVVFLLPALGLSFLADEAFHQVMVVVCSFFAIAAFVPGFKRHRRLLPLAVGVVGLSLISTAAVCSGERVLLGVRLGCNRTHKRSGCGLHRSMLCVRDETRTGSCNNVPNNIASIIGRWVRALHHDARRILVGDGSLDQSSAFMPMRLLPNRAKH